MTDPRRRFQPSELDLDLDPEGAGLLATARELEAYAEAGSVVPSPRFEDRVMAAIATEPLPRPSAGVGFVEMVRNAWAATFGPGRPLTVRAQGAALLLVVAVAVASVGSVVAVGASRLLGPQVTPPPTVASPTPSPTTTPSPSTASSPTPTPSASPAATEDRTAEPTATDDHGGGGAGAGATDDHGGGGAGPTDHHGDGDDHGGSGGSGGGSDDSGSGSDDSGGGSGGGGSDDHSGSGSGGSGSGTDSEGGGS
jgi:hypothetical protein